MQYWDSLIILVNVFGMFREKMNNIRFQYNRRAYILLALASELTR